MSAENAKKRGISGWLILDKPYGWTSTQAVLPPTRTVRGPGTGWLPRTPQKRMIISSGI